MTSDNGEQPDDSPDDPLDDTADDLSNADDRSVEEVKELYEAGTIEPEVARDMGYEPPDEPESDSASASGGFESDAETGDGTAPEEPDETDNAFETTEPGWSDEPDNGDGVPANDGDDARPAHAATVSSVPPADDDDDESADATDDADDGDSLLRRVGEVVGGGVAMPFIWTGRFAKAMGKAFLVGTTRRLPWVGSSMWRDLVKFSVHQYQKATGADVVNFSAEPSGIEPRAANWVEPDDPDEKAGWEEASGDKTWGPGTEGRDVERMGKADVILTDRAAHETATPLQCRIAEALDLEQVDGLIANTTIRQPIIEQYPQAPEDMTADAGQQAVADGGGYVRRQRGQLDIDASEAGLDDALIDLASDFGDGKGMRISARKYKHVKKSVADTEELNNQEIRGFLAGKSGRDEGKLIRLFIYVLAALVLVAVGPTAIQVLFGSGGGGGGGMLPIFLGSGVL